MDGMAMGWMANAALAAWYPAIGVGLVIAGLAAYGAVRWALQRHRSRSLLSHNTLSAALSYNTDGAFALFDGGARPLRRARLIASQLDAQDLVLPLDGDIAIVFARAGSTDRFLARLCRCQLALQSARCRTGAVGAVRPGPQDAASAVLSRASQALITAKSRGPFEVEFDETGRTGGIARMGPASVGPRGDCVSAILCACTGDRIGIRPIPGFGPFAATTLAQLTGRLADCAGVSRDRAGSIVLPVSAELILDYGTVDALGVVLDATEIAPDRLILCPDAPLYPGGQLRDLGIRMATPLLAHTDADLAADGILWLPAATTRFAARDPGRHGLLSDCLSAAGERDIPVLALDIAEAEDAAFLSQLGVSWIEGSAVSRPHGVDNLVAGMTMAERPAADPPGVFWRADRPRATEGPDAPEPGAWARGDQRQRRAGRG